MTPILIRVDASLSIGSGHVMRCRTLARELKCRGAEVSFLCRRQPGDLSSLLEQEFPVLVLPELPLLAAEGLHGRELYGAWLGCSHEQDAADCLQALAQAGINTASWLVVDHYGLDASWESLMLAGLTTDAAAAPRLLVIDDLADRPHRADVLFDQNFFGVETETRYAGLVPAHCRQLLGPHYALLSPEYAQLHLSVPPRTELRRVLLFFGGVDPDNLTGRALEALQAPELAHLAVDVVLGLQLPHRQAVVELVARRPNTTLHNPLPSLAGLIARADLAIGAGGATTWERACLALPSLVVAIADNQLPFAVALAEAGQIQLLGSANTATAEKIREALLEAIDTSWPKPCGHHLTDGRGAAWLAIALLGPQRPLQLRPAAACDEALLLRWASELDVRANSFSLDTIDHADHQIWLRAGLSDATCLLLIACDASGFPLGQISFDRQPPGTGSGPFEALVDLLLDRCARGHGLAAELVRLGLQAMQQRWGSSTAASADVFDNNAVSQATFARARFAIDPRPAPPPPDSTCNVVALGASRITLLSDVSSWLNDHLPRLIEALWERGHAVRWVHHPDHLALGDVSLLLSCGRLLSPEQLAMHRHNLVVHESNLPQGQGWSPMTWQILEDSSQIPVTLFEATAALDAGPIYLQCTLDLQGTEMAAEWRALQAEATIALCLEWLDRYAEVVEAARPQQGEASHYRRRRPADSQLDPDRSLAEQFNLLRVVDNQRYPAFVELRGRRYELHIQPARLRPSQPPGPSSL